MTVVKCLCFYHHIMVYNNIIIYTNLKGQNFDNISQYRYNSTISLKVAIQYSAWIDAVSNYSNDSFIARFDIIWYGITNSWLFYSWVSIVWLSNTVAIVVRTTFTVLWPSIHQFGVKSLGSLGWDTLSSFRTITAFSTCTNYCL